MTDSTAGGSDEVEAGSIRFNERDEIEFYDGEQWRPVEALGGPARDNWDESLIREADVDGPEPG
ncbi:hypothetical protein RKD23_006435 [Streptomyces sp. SAI-170]|uniref:hypothetical protein n=1 Tax=Streptomyces sp. SAI-170 TaxID=3377729 RepID=UPI003C7CA347